MSAIFLDLKIGTVGVALYYADRRMDTTRVIVARCNYMAIETFVCLFFNTRKMVWVGFM